MRNFFLTLALAIGVSFSAFAQKEVVLIDYFSYTTGLDGGQVSNLRSKVMAGISETNRLQVVDIATQTNLATEYERRKEESAMYDETARNTVMKTLGAKYIITGNVTTMSTTKATDKDGNVTFYGNVSWTIYIIDASNGVTKYTKTFTHQSSGGLGGLTQNTGIGATSEEAILQTCNEVQKQMEKVVEEAFPIEGSLIKIETTKKNKAETVYIDLGAAHGIEKGQDFDIFIEVDIAGELSRKNIGSLVAKEVLSANRTLCNVSKGGDLIVEADANGQKLIVVTRKSKGLKAFGQGVGNFFK
ncbi:MAG: penicillin-binding protein activator LpoB [Alistipes sp.]|nr:penicillin-binding protein activator LpoB [Alistipes sp.]